MSGYTATTFAPVQGFIEKSRKLRDLYGASLILSYLSRQITNLADSSVICPGDPNRTKGLPNRLLIKGRVSEERIRQALLEGWGRVLRECRGWVEEKLPEYDYHWQRQWTLWQNHSWEIFWGWGDSISGAMYDLERRKVGRDWSAVNWIGESSSLSGTDAIAWNELGSRQRNPKELRYSQEKDKIDRFYQQLAAVLEGKAPEETPEGKFLDTSERVSLPELVKRLVTHPQIARRIGEDFPQLDRSFSDVIRRPNPEWQTPGRWTGWFMGDGDKVGDYLKHLSEGENADDRLKDFSQAMRDWGKQFEQEFPKSLGRVIYAGGDDFLGVVYDSRADLTGDTLPEATQTLKVNSWNWLQHLPEKWQEHGQKIGLSVGFVWAGHSVPQRDVLQHCREAERRSKNLGRDRLTLRVVFNSGQFVQWTCPWPYLSILDCYCDREGGGNWGHLYNDMAQLKARHAIAPSPRSDDLEDDPLEDESPGPADAAIAIALANIYFKPTCAPFTHLEPGTVGDYLFRELFEANPPPHGTQNPVQQAFINWFDDLVSIGWHFRR
ncbi:CRISPR-associated protein Cmr2 [Phormidium yuhuli AB48]|uniref:CRISPR-associated protein Cmr2 n=1 Tax=Phormidium yuhuli AB48 TaxID=2940671 RepID=A0ABY5ATN7_9CYAN|nr:type III-B CRISPR-associated protein Cas10/Cmr2 [Phormidium yuhuli]USR91706.1 CRISPR-associated protein Cmr2 [Phormidium yuhuli AB48]